ncbi:lycopene cyclase domain-containing protein [Sinomonas halotolerans]|uniref:Lycopene cyclase domain-containing protein n=1 Tax=Sinomonas halotolerans TaxID=1644133 RepID=A0ABU9X6L4_9MICC
MTYLVAILAAAAGVAALDARFRLAFWRAPLATALAVAAGTAFFLAWDVAAIAAGIFRAGTSVWASGIMLAPELPLEEPVFLAFFSYTALALYAGAARILEGRGRAGQNPGPARAAEPDRVAGP